MSHCGWFPLPPEEIRAWVEEHHDSLPTTLAELSTYPAAFRRIIVNFVSPERRTRFWQDHLRTFLEPAGGLTSEQRAFVTETIDQLRGIFGRSSLEEMRAAMKPVESRMSELFTREQCAAMFGMVGPPEPPEGLPIPPGTRLTPIA